MRVERRERVRALNDRLRQQHLGGRIFLSSGLVALGQEACSQALQKIREVADFNERNDPYGEHDFGGIELNGKRVFWKIDYYDHSLTSRAVDPTDPAQCTRVMTVMLAWEY